MPTERPSFLHSSLMWNFQESLSSIKSPRYLILRVSWIFTLLRVNTTLFCNFMPGGRKMINSVLLTLRESLFARSQSYNNYNSLFMVFLITSGSLWEKSRLVSSAKWWTIHFLSALCMSLMYIRKSRGPRIDPCGTPQFISRYFDSKPLDFVHCFLLVKYERNHSSEGPLIP